MKDTLKVSGVQVSPSEIEIVLLEHPARLISDVSVAGVPGVRMSDEKVPRAWIVLSDAGRKRGSDNVVRELDAWVKKRLSKPKWVRGGFSVVGEVNSLLVVVLNGLSVSSDTEVPDWESFATCAAGEGARRRRRQETARQVVVHAPWAAAA